MPNFALLGLAGYIAPRHLQAIQDTGNELIAASDPHDSVGVVDKYFPRTAFFTEIERFDRHLEKLRRGSEDQKVHYTSICTPNYLHDAHVRLALRTDSHAICEKPLIIMPKNFAPLLELEAETSKRIYSILQLRLHPSVIELKQKLSQDKPDQKYNIVLSYITGRGAWYRYSWKGSEEKSGGVAMNIGIHFFDLLIWLFGGVESFDLHLKQRDKLSGALELERARVRWFLSVDGKDLPPGHESPAFRSLQIDGEEFNFSGGFTDLHTESYKEILAGRGFGIEEGRAGIELVHSLRQAEVVNSKTNRHPLLG